MYRIFADDTLIYDSTIEDYKIGSGKITREVGKSGSFVFSVYPDHFYYEQFVKLKTVITVYKSGRIVFRGRILNDVTDYWNVKTITCEGEMGFLQDSVIRPFSFEGTPAELFTYLIGLHNSQVDEFKQFKIGSVTVVDDNDYVDRSSQDYATTLSTLNSATTETTLGGYIHITHGDDGTDPVPTIHYLADFDKVSAQVIEFGSNLKDYTKTDNAEELATAIIPLGANTSTEGHRLTIADVNGGVDYLYDEAAVALRGWVFKTVLWENVTLANHLLTKAKAYLEHVVKQSLTIELNAIDLHLLDRSIESFNVCDYVHVVSKPHNFDSVMLCNKQTIDLLKPENDTVVLGYTSPSFTGASVQLGASVSTLGKQVSSISQDATNIELSVQNLSTNMGHTLRISADGVRITDAAGNDVEINGGQIRANSITSSSLQAGSITSEKIKSDSITTDSLHLGGDLTVYDDIDSNVIGGYLGYTTSALDGAVGIHMQCGSGEVVATTHGAKLMYSNEHDQIYIGGTNAGIISGGRQYYFDLDGFWTPDGVTLGTASAKWGQIYSTNSAISTSDRNAKNSIETLPEKYVAMLNGVTPRRFKLNDGTSDRYHVGFIAQEVEDAMNAAGVSSKEFGGFVKAVDDVGREIYMLRYEEFIGVLLAKINELDARLTALEGGASR